MWGAIISIVILIIFLFWLSSNRLNSNIHNNPKNKPDNPFCCKYDYGPLWWHITGYPRRSMQGRAWYRLPIRTIDRQWWKI